MLGRTKTASNATKVDLAVVSCTSLWSGFFNFYRQLASEEVDAVVHLGDLIYDKPDPDELVRVPDEFRCDQETSLHVPNVATRMVLTNVVIRVFVMFVTESAGMLVRKSCCLLLILARAVQVMDDLRDAFCHTSDLTRYRALHSVHMFDPDFRLARSRHPFIVIYDNHDVNWPDANNSMRAFREWVPIRVREPSQFSEGSFRHFEFGSKLVDVYVLDTTASAGTQGLLGSEQEDWLEAQLQESSGTWRLFASPKTFMPLTLNRIGPALAVPVACVSLVLLMQAACCRILMRRCPSLNDEARQDSQVCSGKGRAVTRIVRSFSFCSCCICWLWTLAGAITCALLIVKLDTHNLNLLHATDTTWEGQPRSRNLLFQQLQQSGRVSNNIWAVGDMHFSYLADVFQFDFFGRDLFTYSPEAVAERFGVEFMPGSGSRGNMDEKVGELLGPLFAPPSLVSRVLAGVIDYAIRSANPHLRHFEGSEHGYGLLKIAAHQVQASWVRFDVLGRTDGFTRVSGMHVNVEDNQWSLEPALVQTTCASGH